MTNDLFVAPLKLVAALGPETLLKNLDLTLAKNYKRLKQIVFLLLASTFYESNLQ